jgi:hypothetical protein
LRLLVVGVTVPGPEEAAQAITPGPRHDMGVQVRDALADDVVHGDERSLRAKGIGNGGADRPDGAEERHDQLVGQVRKSHDVLAGDDQDMTLEKRPRVEERDNLLAGQDDVRWNRPCGYGAERAVGHLRTVAFGRGW